MTRASHKVFDPPNSLKAFLVDVGPVLSGPTTWRAVGDVSLLPPAFVLAFVIWILAVQNNRLESPYFECRTRANTVNPPRYIDLLLSMLSG
jgi:hypothetical protein